MSSNFSSLNYTLIILQLNFEAFHTWRNVEFSQFYKKLRKIETRYILYFCGHISKVFWPLPVWGCYKLLCKKESYDTHTPIRMLNNITINITFEYRTVSNGNTSSCVTGNVLNNANKFTATIQTMRSENLLFIKMHIDLKC